MRLRDDKSMKAVRFLVPWGITVLLALPAIGRAKDLRDGDISGPNGGPDPQWGQICFVNGVRTSPGEAVAAANGLADQLNARVQSADHIGVHVIYNDLQLQGIRALDQSIALVIEKLGDRDVSVNPATDACLRCIRTICESGKEIWLVGHSAGTLCIQNAIIAADAYWRSHASYHRKDYLSRIKVVFVGGAVFRDSHLLADGTPRGITKFEIHDLLDDIAQFAGPGEWGEGKAEAHGLLGNYRQWLTRPRFGQSGELLIRDQRLLLEIVATAPDPAARVMRIRIEDLRATQESRRTRLNFCLPWKGDRVGWHITGHPNPGRIRFTIMQDVPFGPDEPKSLELLNDSVTDRYHGSDNYVGRVSRHPGFVNDHDEDLFWKDTADGFFLEARPIEP